MLTFALVLAFGSLLAPAVAYAQGFGVYEQGACMMARGAAGVAKPCDDGSAIYVNPAGLVGPEGVTIGTGGMLVLGSGGFTSDSGVRTSLDTGASLVPAGYFVYGMSPRLAVGVGVYAPYGLTVKWPIEFPGRFVSYDSTLTTITIQPTVAYALTDRVSVGGGLAIVRSSVELIRREDLATVPLGTTGLSFGALVDPQTDFATTELSSRGAMGAGAHLGVIVKASERISLGARYLTHVDVSYDGDATFTPVGASFRVTRANPLGLPVGTPIDTLVTQVYSALPNQAASTALDLPAQFVLGASVRATERVTTFADYHWVGWSAFDSVTIDFSSPSTPDERLVQNYRDSHAGRLGAEVAITPQLHARGGYAYTSAAAPDETVTPLLPEARRNHFMAGIGWMPRPRFSIDLAYQFVAHDDRRGRTVNPPPGEPPTVALNSGVYRSRGDLLGLTVTFRP
jgi:long-chain fatty acid transport protein